MNSAARRGGAAALIAILLTVLTPARPGPARACLVVGGVGSQVQTDSEEAIIVWDAPHHREDFIRRATFRTGAHDFGFLVPTPTVPTLTAVRPSAFIILDRLSQRSLTRERDRTTSDAAPQAGGVKVLRAQRVGAYDAAVLSADDLRGLAGWLHKHGYVTPPTMADWLTPYVEAHWAITAFKVTRDAQDAPTASLPPVRLSFWTDRPFYPYREPFASAQSGETRLLRVFFLNSLPGTGGFEDASAHAPWPGRVITTHNLDGFDPNFRPDIASRLALAPSQMPSPLWLTTFEDHSSPRPAVADVYFADAPPSRQSPTDTSAP